MGVPSLAPSPLHPGQARPVDGLPGLCHHTNVLPRALEYGEARLRRREEQGRC
ncbi:hypothetical protein ACUTAH_24300 [Metapseudomonas furukawaii]|uniref:hypothetical protein n=1 Tax=Metapseudomonas furukawaii TaxID=1149133 RepID=UPI00404585D0